MKRSFAKRNPLIAAISLSYNFVYQSTRSQSLNKAFTVLFFPFLISPISAQTNEEIKAILSTYNNHGMLDGSVLVSFRDSIVYEGGFGFSNIEHGVPNTPETKFRIASMTNIFTATMIFQLAEEEKLFLDDKIGKYLSVLREELGDQITIEQLLTHTSGLEREYLKEDIHSKDEFTTLDLIKKVSANYDLSFAPRESVSYNNAGYVLLAEIIEKATHQHYHEALKKKIFVPLGMRNSGYESSDLQFIPNLVSGYRLRLDTYMIADQIDVQ
ncbi:MAG: serine hydrolase, partial [Ekhidna sp.]|nr:serine hydrolase [Ekhidna sp.]